MSISRKTCYTGHGAFRVDRACQNGAWLDSINFVKQSSLSKKENPTNMPTIIFVLFASLLLMELCFEWPMSALFATEAALVGFWRAKRYPIRMAAKLWLKRWQQSQRSRKYRASFETSLRLTFPLLSLTSTFQPSPISRSVLPEEYQDSQLRQPCYILAVYFESVGKSLSPC